MSNENKNEKDELKEKENIEEEKKTKDLTEEEKKILEVFEVKKDKSFKRTIILGVFVLIAVFIGMHFYNTQYVSNSKYAFKFNDTKIERSITEQLKDNFSSEEEMAYFIVDTLHFSKIAEEEGITVTEEEINEVGKEFSVYQKEIALSDKLIKTYQEKTNNLTDEDLKKLYEENKELYVKKGKLKFLALNSSSVIPADEKLTPEEIEQYPSNEDTIESLLAKGLYPNELLKDKFILVDFTQDENNNPVYRYFYIYDKEVTEYSTFEESKEYIIDEYDKTHGYQYLMSKKQALEETTTIEYYN